MDARYVAGSPRVAEEAQVARGPRSRLVRRAALAVVGLSTLALAAPASATTETFEYTGTAQTWTVPAGVTRATFDLYGAQGFGDASDPRFLPGFGGRATRTIAVIPGDSIQVNVGGQGGFEEGGFNGGGSSTSSGRSGGGFGGGASDIRIGGTDFDDRVLVAGGGGASGSFVCGDGSSNGGDGGGETGDPGTPNGCPGAARGGGGTQSAGGTATAPATAGDFGVGGQGAIINQFGGGGGGGGWYGGGGGIGGAPGGGGSGHGPAGTVFETGVRSGNGLVTVTYPVSPPTIDGPPPLDDPPPPIDNPPALLGGPPALLGGPPALPDNSFTFGKLKRNLQKGTAKLTVNVPGGGELELAKTKKVKADDESAEDAGKEKLLVKPRGKAKKKLNQTGKAKVKANVTFTPTGGEPNTESKKVTLKLSPH
jgi:Glycine rich protein